MAKEKKSEVLFSNEFWNLFQDGAIKTLVAMLVSLVTMWLVSIFTILIDIQVIIIVSTGIGISFGAMHILNLTSTEK
jgi:hypothetical protein